MGVLFFFNTKFAYSQMIINSNLLTMPVLVELPNTKLYGSGFFYGDSNSIFLVTAKHVLFELEHNSLIDSQAVIYSYPHNPEKDDPNILNIDLKELIKLNRYILSGKQDICAIEIAKTTLTEDSSNFLVQYFKYIEKSGPSTRISSYNVIQTTSFDSTKVSTDLFIFGYPISLSSERQFDYKRPILRKGIIAGKNELTKTLIIDCPVYPGNSGGPVVIQEQKSLGYFVYTIVGIVSEYIPFKDYWQSISNKRIVHEEAYNSGLSVVVPIDELFEILSLYKYK